MTVQNTIVKNVYVGNGSTTVFPFTFECNKAEHIQAFVKDALGNISSTTNFKVNLEQKNVTYPNTGEPLPDGYKLIILRQLPLQQLLNLLNQGPFYAEDIEETFDEVVMMLQQMTERIGRSLAVSIDIDAENSFNTIIPLEAGKTFRVKEDGTGFEVTEDPGKVIDGAKALLKQTTEQAEFAKEQADASSQSAVNAQNAANKAENMVATLPSNWQDTVDYAALAKIKTDGFITPEMFGAVGDGVADDTEAIKLSLDYMSKNNLLVLHLTKTYRITNLIKTNIQQLRIVGEHMNNSCIYCDGTIAGLEIGDGNNECFEIVLDNFWIRGNNNNTSWLLSLNRCTNIYLTRFHISNGNKDDNGCLAYFNKANIVYIDKSVIEGGSNLKTTNASGNGLKISGNGSILDISRCNIWNLNNVLIIEGNLSNFSFRENWCECVRSFLKFEVDSVTDMRYLALNIRGNTFNVHNVIVADFTLEINSFAFITFNSSTSTNFYMGKILLDNNNFYFDSSNSLFSIGNNSLIAFLGGMLNDGTLNIEFNNNVFSGKSLSELGTYVYKNTLNLTQNEIYFSSIKTFTSTDLTNITDDCTLIKCGLPITTKQRCWFPRGVNLSNYVAGGEAGELYYEDGDFWIRYEDGLKMLPKKATQTISYATNDTILTELNKVITALAQAGIASRVE